jgi:hypothetical protein
MGQIPGGNPGEGRDTLGIFMWCAENSSAVRCVAGGQGKSEASPFKDTACGKP